MSSLYAMFKSNESREKEEGICLDYGEAKIRVRRAGGSNRRYSDLVSKKLRPFKRQLENESLDPDTGSRIMAEVYAESVLIGWEGVKDADGNPIAFSRENAVKLLTDLPELFRDIQEQSQRLANFRDEEIEEDRKN